ncbi:MAG: Phosphotransferase enzyme [Claussenomyces sp. TS43310]|nr:MAG: Phosphotransferase enzyme [Claussenomyces sp. TS43310]
MSERNLHFNKPELLLILAKSSGHAVFDIANFQKLAEGGYNRVFEATMKDGSQVIARLPYPSTVPKILAIASEVATLDYLALHGFPVPKVWWHKERANVSTDRGPLAGIPKHLQNYGDPESERLVKPKKDLPEHFESLPPEEQARVREQHRRRLVHFLYSAFTSRLNKEHYNAIFNNAVIHWQRLFKSASSPWKAEIAGSGTERCKVCPLVFDRGEASSVLKLDMEQKDADDAMEKMRDAVGIDVLGWVPDQEQYDLAKERAEMLKVEMLQGAGRDEERQKILAHWPFDDHDEDGC